MVLVETDDIVKVFKVAERRSGFRSSRISLFNRQYREIRAVDGLSLRIEQGEILGLIGPNGAGKSTMVKILTGILTPDHGTAVVDGVVPYKNRQKIAEKIGVVFGQRTRLWWVLPVSDSLEYIQALYSIQQGRYKRNLDYLGDVLSLHDLMDKPVRTLSLGQRMRVEIAAAMLHDPMLLYLDEPTVGLDVVGKNELRSLIHKINQDRNVTVLLVTHDVIDIEKLCTRLVVIDKGKQVWEGTVNGLKQFHGRRKRIEVEFSGAVEPIAAEGVSCRSQQGSRHVYEIDDAILPINEFVQRLSRSGRYVDLKITEPEIEEVIREIYRA